MQALDAEVVCGDVVADCVEQLLGLVGAADEEIADESLVVTLCYEAYLAMQQMLVVFADMRGDDAEGASS